MQSSTLAIYGRCVRCGRVLCAGMPIWYEQGVYLCAHHPRRQAARSRPVRIRRGKWRTAAYPRSPLPAGP